MKIISRPRASGKTTELIKMCAENGGYIVCSDGTRCNQIAKQANQLGLSIAFPMTFKEFITGKYYSPNVKKFFLDDIDAMLQSISIPTIEAITLTDDSQDIHNSQDT
jgi:hypothetical protein